MYACVIIGTPLWLIWFQSDSDVYCPFLVNTASPSTAPVISIEIQLQVTVYPLTVQICIWLNHPTLSTFFSLRTCSYHCKDIINRRFLACYARTYPHEHLTNVLNEVIYYGGSYHGGYVSQRVVQLLVARCAGETPHLEEQLEREVRLHSLPVERRLDRARGLGLERGHHGVEQLRLESVESGGVEDGVEHVRGPAIAAVDGLGGVEKRGVLVRVRTRDVWHVLEDQLVARVD